MAFEALQAAYHGVGNYTEAEQVRITLTTLTAMHRSAMAMSESMAGVADDYTGEAARESFFRSP